MSDEDANYYRGVDDARKFWIERCRQKINKLLIERKKLQSPNLISYCEGYIAGVAWCEKQGQTDRYIIPEAGQRADNDEDLVPPWNSLP